MTVQPGSRIEAKPHLRAVPPDGVVAPVRPQSLPPRFPPDLVGLHPALWLERLADHEIALVRAPAGYGKSAWCAALFAEARAAGWQAFWADAGQVVAGEICDDVRRACEAGPEDRPCLLIVDDADRPADAQVIASLDALLSPPPARLRLVLAGRGSFTVATGDAAGRGMVLAVGARDLAIAGDAAASISGWPRGTIDALMEGWPAGLRLAKHADGPDALAERVADYFGPLIAELSPAERTFVQRVAVAPAFNAELARLLSGDEGADKAVEALMTRGLFMDRAVGQARGRAGWFRLHPAFRMALLRGLADAEPDAPKQLSRAASRYLASQEMPAEAIDQAIAGGDFDAAARLVGAIALSMIERGELAPLAAWLDALPPDLVARTPELPAARAWLAVLTGRGDSADALAALAASGAVAEAQVIDLVHRAYFGDDFTGVVESCDQILAAPDGLSDLAVAMVRAMLAQGALKRGLFGLVHEVARPLRLQDRRRPLDLPLALAICTRAALARAQGQLAEAERILRDGGPVCTGTLAAALIDAALARCCYERDDLVAAAELAERAMAPIEASPFQDALVSCYLVAIRVAAGTGESGRAASLIDRAELVAFERGWMPLKAMCIVERARLRLPPTIDAEAVLSTGEEAAAVRDPLSVQARTFALLAEMRAYEAIANGDRPRLTTVADHLLLLASAADDAELRASATLFNILPQLSGRCDKMVELETVRFLNHAASSGFLRTIVDVLDVTGVRAVQNFCSEAYSSGSFLALLKLAEPSRRNPALEGGPGAAPGEAFSFLTEREIEILSALNAGESNKEIARSLQLAPETVKWHLKNIMRKLRAGSREEAVANAATLGLKLIEAP